MNLLPSSDVTKIHFYFYFVRLRQEGQMWVDREGPYSGTSQGKFLGLDLMQPLYLGAVPDFSKIHKQAGFNTGFVGKFPISS
jgi:hypothetical protein